MIRLCRFVDDDLELAGFYRDDLIVPLVRAVEAYSEATGQDVPPPASEEEDLLEYLPPNGEYAPLVAKVAAWLETHTAEALGDLAIPLEQVTLRTPIPAPGKILLLAGNYSEHVAEQGGVAAERLETFPYVFMKPLTTLNDPFGPIVIPKVSPDRIDWECELGVVIGRTCRHVEASEALEYVAGYTVVNDVSDRGFKPNPGRKPRERDRFFDWLHGKWHDTFLPVGPCILAAGPRVDPQGFRLTLRVNDEVKQNDTTAKMVFPVAEIVSFLSRMMTLEPGDLIATGTPSGVGNATGTFLKPGDVVRAAIEGIGVLENPVESEE